MEELAEENYKMTRKRGAGNIDPVLKSVIQSVQDLAIMSGSCRIISIK